MSARVACVCAHELALQTLVRDRPSWRDAPVALVSEDRPDAPLVALNAHAVRAGLSVGMRCGAARNLVATLHAGAVSEERVRASVASIAEALRGLSPKVEPDTFPGVFIVDASGLGRLHRDVRAWALAVRRAVSAKGFVASVAVGFDRRVTRAIALDAQGIVVARTAQHELTAAGDVPLRALGLPPRVRATLDALGLDTLGALWALPFETVSHRFGPEVAELRAWAVNDASVPVQPDTPREPTRAVIEVEPPDDDQARILFSVRGALHLLVGRLASTGEAVSALHLSLSLEDRTRVEHRVEPAAPTRDVALLVDLARLRLAEGSLSARVREAEVTVDPAPLRGEQLALFAHERARDPRAVARAVARVRAAFGDASVTRARLRDAHLPEAGFAWEPHDFVPPAKERARAPEAPSPPGETPLVRRLISPPREVSPSEIRSLSPVSHETALGPWLREDAANETAHDAPSRDAWSRVTPSRVHGAWWARPVTRDYYYAEASDGSLLWVFYDHRRARWFLHGVVD